MSPPPSTPSSFRSAINVLGWACYLACSWTWCIGMYLPVLLIRDYGVWGFVVFAVPNVIGAAAMGWVLRRDGTATLMAHTHAPAIHFFSKVTVVFQCFFLGWANVLLAPYGFTTVLGIVLFAAVFLAWRASERSVLATSVCVFALSTAALVQYAWLRPLSEPPTLPLEAQQPDGLPHIGLICAFGFLLCPYLDLTFLRARAQLPGAAGTTSFVLGFGVLFLMMIGFTYLYSPQARDLVWFSGIAQIQFDAFTWLAAHVFIQLLFTIAVHLLELNRTRPQSERLTGSNVRSAVVGLLIPFALGIAATWLPSARGLSMPELIYRLFMSFYGLVFPAYVWLCMIPFPRAGPPISLPLPLGEGRGEGLRAAAANNLHQEEEEEEEEEESRKDPHPALSRRERERTGTPSSMGEPSRRAITVWLTACLLAAPCYWMGFIERVEWWLIPGLAIVLLGKLFIPRAGRGSSTPPPEPYGAPVPAHSGPPGLSAAAEPEH